MTRGRRVDEKGARRSLRAAVFCERRRRRCFAARDLQLDARHASLSMFSRLLRFMRDDESLRARTKQLQRQAGCSSRSKLANETVFLVASLSHPFADHRERRTRALGFRFFVEIVIAAGGRRKREAAFCVGDAEPIDARLRVVLYVI